MLGGYLNTQRMKIAKYVGLKHGGGDSASTQGLNFAAVTRGYLKAPMPPGRDQRDRDAKILCQAGGAVVVDEASEFVHARKFRKSQVSMQGNSLECLKDASANFGYSKVMNTPSTVIPWYVVAKRRLKELKKTQVWLADQVNVHESAVSHWLHGTHIPSLEKLKRIAELLDMSLAEMLEHDDSIAQSQEELQVMRAMRAASKDQVKQVKELLGLIAAKPGDSTPPQEKDIKNR